MGARHRGSRCLVEWENGLKKIQDSAFSIPKIPTLGLWELLASSALGMQPSASPSLVRSLDIRAPCSGDPAASVIDLAAAAAAADMPAAGSDSDLDDGDEDDDGRGRCQK